MINTLPSVWLKSAFFCVSRSASGAESLGPVHSSTTDVPTTAPQDEGKFSYDDTHTTYTTYTVTITVKLSICAT